MTDGRKRKLALPKLTLPKLKAPAFLKAGTQAVVSFFQAMQDAVRSSELGKDAYVHPFHFLGFWITLLLFCFWIYSLVFR